MNQFPIRLVSVWRFFERRRTTRFALFVERKSRMITRQLKIVTMEKCCSLLKF